MIRTIIIGLLSGYIIGMHIKSDPPISCPDKHEAMQQAIEFSIEGYELGPPMPMQQKPIMVSDLGE